MGDAATPQSDPKPTRSKVVAVDARTFTDMMEQLQEGYVTSVASTAGCSVERIPRDTYGFDIRLICPGPPGQEEVTLLVQLKNTTTIKPDPEREFFSYQLRKREYLERLAVPRGDVKALLIVMATSGTQVEWTAADHELMTVKYCCYWRCLEGHPVDQKVASPSVRIPTANIFDAPALTRIMDMRSRGEPLV